VCAGRCTQDRNKKNAALINSRHLVYPRPANDVRCKKDAFKETK